MTRHVALVAVFALAGCVTTAVEPSDVGRFKGQPGAPILARLGPPDSRETVGNAAVYRWRTSVLQESAPVTTSTVTYGSGLPSNVPVTTFRPQEQYCTLVLTVDAAGRVTDFVRDGSRQACAPLIDKLGV
jgi:hypothetical protein